jgi:hypothetical protein
MGPRNVQSGTRKWRRCRYAVERERWRARGALRCVVLDGGVNRGSRVGSGCGRFHGAPIHITTERPETRQMHERTQ